MPRYHLYMRHYDNLIALSSSVIETTVDTIEELTEEIKQIADHNEQNADSLVITRLSVEYSEDTNGKI